MGEVTRTGGTLTAGSGISYVWSSSDASGAPNSAALGALGCASTGGSTGAIYFYSGSSWNDTGATLQEFIKKT